MKTLLAILLLIPSLALAESMTAAEFEACLNNIPCLTAYTRGQAFHEEQPTNTVQEELDARLLGVHPLSLPTTRGPFLGLSPLIPLYPQTFYPEPVQHW